MSGGSFGYLCYATDLYELVEHRIGLREMADELDALPWAERAALDTRALVAELDAFDQRVRTRTAALERVWHAVEWWRSGDFSEDQVRDAVAGYEPSNLPSAELIADLIGRAREAQRHLAAAIDRAEESA